MSIATRVEEIENHLVDDWNAVAGVGGDTSLDKNIENIARALDNVYDELPKVSGEGTSVTLNNTKKGRVSSVLKGNTSQDTTNGKNLLNLKDTLNATHNGISYTYNSDGSFSFSGTATSNASHVNADTNISLANGDYTFSIKSALSVDIKIQIYFTDSTNVGRTISAGSTSTSVTISKEVSKFYVGLMNLTSGTSYSGKVYAMLESGSTATDFEPFTYGSTPNPNYPQPIHVVSGDNNIEVCGKNLVNVSNQTITSLIAIENINTKNISGNITLSLNYINNGSVNGVVRLREYGSSTNLKSIVLEANSSGNKSTNLDVSSYNAISIIFQGTSSGYNYNISNVQVEVGSTATDFEPYQGKDYTINLGNNLFDKDSATYKNNRFKNDNGVESSYVGRGYLTSYISVLPNTTYSFTKGIERIYYYDNSKTWIERTGSNPFPRTFTTPNNCYYIQFQYEIEKYDENTISIQEGNSASYVPYNKNLFDKDNANYISNLTVNSSQMKYSSRTGGVRLYYIPCKPNTTYIYSKTLGSFVRFASSPNIPAKDGIVSVVNSETSSEISGNKAIITTAANDNYLTFYPLLSSEISTIGFDNVLEDVSIREENAIELCKIGDYQDKLIRSSGKNLFDKDNANIYNGYIASTTNHELSSSNNSKTLYIPCLPNTTYCISKISSAYFRTGYTHELPTTNVYVYGYSFNTASSKSITTDSNAKYLVCTYWINSDTLTEQEIRNSIMIEEGSTATSYEPYGYGKWYKYGAIGKVVLDGVNKAWTGANALGDNYRVNLSIPDVMQKSTNSADVYSNYFNGDVSALSQQNAKVGMFCIYHDTTNFYFIVTQNFNDANEWLKTHNTSVYYTLATPTITEITNTYLINQLNDYYNAQSYQNQTNISQENNDLPFEISASALLDTNTYINQLEEQIEVLS